MDFATYAWIIDTDFGAEDGAEPGSRSENAADITGPVNAPAGLISRLLAGEGREFLMLDDDGGLYYAGRIVTIDPAGGGEADFGPLDDFGRPNAGAVSIWYKDGLVWKML